MATADPLVVALAGLIVAAGVVPGLGFYSDDWVLIATFRLAADQSVAGLFAASYTPHFASRPVQALYSILLYKSFGVAPLGYHLVNATVLAMSAALFTAVLARLGAPRAASLGAGLVFASLPSFSTDRVWFAAYAAPLSVLGFLVSLWIDLASVEARGVRLAGWRALSLATASTALLAYELTLPLVLLSPLVAGWHARRRGSAWSFRQWGVWVLPTLFVIAGIGLYKAERSGRLGSLANEPDRIAGIARQLLRADVQDGDYGLNLPRAVAVNFGDHGVRLPVHAWALRRRVPGPLIPGLLAAASLAAAAYVRRAARQERWRARTWAGLAAGGAGVFLAGYAVFLTNTAIQITPTGVGNRTAIAAGLGVALIVVGVLGMLAAAVPVRTWRAPVFATTLAIYLACGAFTNTALASYWREAYRREQAIVADITRHLPAPAPRTTLFLGGVCPYVGPAIVFESSWDLAFALRLAYGLPSLAGDVVSRRFRARPDRITTSLYEEPYEWPYGRDTLLYDSRRKRLFTLTDQTATLAALHEAGLPPQDCPPGMEGVGVPVFRR